MSTVHFLLFTLAAPGLAQTLTISPSMESAVLVCLLLALTTSDSCLLWGASGCWPKLAALGKMLPFTYDSAQ